MKTRSQGLASPVEELRKTRRKMVTRKTSSRPATDLIVGTMPPGEEGGTPNLEAPQLPVDNAIEPPPTPPIRQVGIPDQLLALPRADVGRDPRHAIAQPSPRLEVVGAGSPVRRSIEPQQGQNVNEEVVGHLEPGPMPATPPDVRAIRGIMERNRVEMLEHELEVQGQGLLVDDALQRIQLEAGGHPRFCGIA